VEVGQGGAGIRGRGAPPERRPARRMALRGGAGKGRWGAADRARRVDRWSVFPGPRRGSTRQDIQADRPARAIPGRRGAIHPAGRTHPPVPGRGDGLPGAGAVDRLDTRGEGAVIFERPLLLWLAPFLGLGVTLLALWARHRRVGAAAAWSASLGNEAARTGRRSPY